MAEILSSILIANITNFVHFKQNTMNVYEGLSVGTLTLNNTPYPESIRSNYHLQMYVTTLWGHSIVLAQKLKFNITDFYG